MGVATLLRDVLLAGVALLAASSAANADMGLAPAGPGDVYLSGEGGYLLQDGLDINAYGISLLPGSVVDATVSADDGWFAGAMIGWEKGSRLI